MAELRKMAAGKKFEAVVDIISTLSGGRQYVPIRSSGQVLEAIAFV